MLINNILYTVVVVLLSIAVLWGVSRFIRKKLKNSQSFVIGFFLSGVVFVGLMFGIGRLYIVDENKDVQTYRVFGTFEYGLADGNTITRTYDPDSVMIINNSFNNLVLEEILYSRSGDARSSTAFPVRPWSCQSFSLPGNRIYYFFDDEIDETIDEGSNKPVGRFWLHGDE